MSDVRQVPIFKALGRDFHDMLLKVSLYLSELIACATLEVNRVVFLARRLLFPDHLHPRDEPDSDASQIQFRRAVALPGI
jgi:hypothetical protein